MPAVKQEDMEAKCFQLNRVAIVSNISDENSLNFIIDHLLSQQIVTNAMMEIVTVQRTLSDKIRALLDILVRRQKGTFSVFCQALVLTGHQDLCEKLENTMKSLDPSYTFLQIDANSESTPGPNTGHVTTEQQTDKRFRHMLSEIAEELGGDDLNELRFLFRDVLKEKHEIKNVMDLFNILIDGKIIHIGEVGSIVEALEMMQKNILSEKIKDFYTQHTMPVPMIRSYISKFTALLYNFGCDLTKDDINKLMFLHNIQGANKEQAKKNRWKLLSILLTKKIFREGDVSSIREAAEQLQGTTESPPTEGASFNPPTDHLDSDSAQYFAATPPRSLADKEAIDIDHLIGSVGPAIQILQVRSKLAIAIERSVKSSSSAEVAEILRSVAHEVQSGDDPAVGKKLHDLSSYLSRRPLTFVRNALEKLRSAMYGGSDPPITHILNSSKNRDVLVQINFPREEANKLKTADWSTNFLRLSVDIYNSGIDITKDAFRIIMKNDTYSESISNALKKLSFMLRKITHGSIVIFIGAYTPAAFQNFPMQLINGNIADAIGQNLVDGLESAGTDIFDNFTINCNINIIPASVVETAGTLQSHAATDPNEQPSQPHAFAPVAAEQPMELGDTYIMPDNFPSIAPSSIPNGGQLSSSFSKISVIENVENPASNKHTSTHPAGLVSGDSQARDQHTNTHPAGHPSGDSQASDQHASTHPAGHPSGDSQASDLHANTHPAGRPSRYSQASDRHANTHPAGHPSGDGQASDQHASTHPAGHPSVDGSALNAESSESDLESEDDASQTAPKMVGIQAKEDNLPNNITAVEMSRDEMREFFDESGQHLCEGGAGKIYEGVKKYKGLKVVVKVMHKCTNEDRDKRAYDSYCTEMMVSRKKHPFLLPLLAYSGRCLGDESSPENRQYYLMYPYMENRDLQWYLKQVWDGQSRLEWTDRVRILYQTAIGLQYLHSSGEESSDARRGQILHRDVKSANILLDENLNARLGDPGLAKELDDGISRTNITSQTGTPGYIDPYVGQTGEFRPINDVFGLGVVMLQLLLDKTERIEVKNKRGKTVKQNLEVIWRRKSEKELLEESVSAWPKDGEQKKFTEKFVNLALKALAQPVIPEDDVDDVRISLNELCEAMENLLCEAGITRWNSPTPSSDAIIMCVSCMGKQAAKVKPLSLSCNESCAQFCRGCLSNHMENPLCCPKHGSCLPSVGHKNKFVLMVSANVADKDERYIFSADLKTMKKVLMDKTIIGVRPENIHTIDGKDVPSNKQMKTRVFEELANIEKDMKEKPHAFFLFYFSGHHSNKRFRVGRGTTDMDYLTEQELKDRIHRLNAEYMLFILDTCYSGGADLGAKDDNPSLQTDNSMQQESAYCAPVLWDLFQLSTDGPDLRPKDENTRHVIQWSSSTKDQTSFYSRRKKRSIFTRSITKLLTGKCLSSSGPCDHCKTYRDAVRLNDCIFLKPIHNSVLSHVKQFVLQQRQNEDITVPEPQLSPDLDDEEMAKFPPLAYNKCQY
ncbi:uncharacterized protein LOC121378532 [Gigantopelta aegis]|uniref:uncharacterized protein LOC121378532 n=1 Tax=Gigantopelta aegis TaxID=1735272 RepID=UPI001B887E0E|nr:uncharacterized protein LOC121378532 [Gigantopelta aegis]